MAYLALYRKYRPDTFDDVKGQDAVITTLRNQIEAGRIGHAYLFCGTRGTGKTTAAKIFAKAVNCEHPVNGSPCGKCASCRSIAEGTSLNVLEIDAASNNGVDTIRQIRDDVTYAPTEGKYRVYIIDEAHMLSGGAANALLKTLEEPPSYVIFILATTEPQKIPVTVLSRCQRYDFQRISIDTIAGRLTELMQKEGIQTQERAIRYIAKAAEGSMRDALSLLDQCISYYIGQELTYDKVLDVLGAVDTEIFQRLLQNILDDDVAGAVGIVEELIQQGRELGQFVTDFIWYLRNLLLLQASDEIEDALDVSAENLEELKQMAFKTDQNTLIRYIRIFSELSNEMRFASQKRVLLEIAIIKLCRPEMEEGSDALEDRVARLERKIEQGVPAAQQTAGGMSNRSDLEGSDAGHTKQETVEKQAILEKAVPEDVREVVRRWPEIVRSLKMPVMQQYAGQAQLSLDENSKLVLVFSQNMAYTYLSDDSHRKVLSDVINRTIGKDVSFDIRENTAGRSATDNFADLSKIIHMDIEIDED